MELALGASPLRIGSYVSYRFPTAEKLPVGTERVCPAVVVKVVKAATPTASAVVNIRLLADQNPKLSTAVSEYRTSVIVKAIDDGTAGIAFGS